MEIGTEISQKIRSAIKAKLMELGAYVDEELPDYIMVMVANKKSENAMTEDLNLFLGSNTEKFTAWLHSLLVKLQSLSASKKKDEQAKVAKDTDKSSDKKSSKPRRKSSEKKTELTTASKSKEVSKTDICHVHVPVKQKSVEKPVSTGKTSKDSSKPASSVPRPSETLAEPRTKVAPKVTPAPPKNPPPPLKSKPVVHKTTSEHFPKVSALVPKSEPVTPKVTPQPPKNPPPPLKAKAPPAAPLAPPKDVIVVQENTEAIDANTEDAVSAETVPEVSGVQEDDTSTTLAKAETVEETVEEPEFTVKAEYDEFSEEFTQEAEKAALAEQAEKQSVTRERVPVVTGHSAVRTATLTPEPAAERSVSPPSIVTEEVDTEEDDAPVQSTTTVFARISPLPPAVDGRSVTSRLGSAAPPAHRVPPVARQGVQVGGRKVHIDREAPSSEVRVITREPMRRAVTNTVTTELGTKRRMPGSVLGTVKSRRLLEAEPEDEEYDPLNPAVGNVASVVKVTPRRSSVPRRMRANSSLLLKAVNEATKSVGASRPTHAGSAYIPIERSVERGPAKSRSHFTRMRRDEIMQSLKREVLREPARVPVKREKKMQAFVDEDTETDSVMETEDEVPVTVTQREMPESGKRYKLVEVTDSTPYVGYADDSRLVNVSYRSTQQYQAVESGHLLQADLSSSEESPMEGEELILMETEPVAKVEPMVKVEPMEQLVTYAPSTVRPVEKRKLVAQYTAMEVKAAKRQVKEKQPVAVPAGENTRFIVTLDGVDPIGFSEKESGSETEQVLVGSSESRSEASSPAVSSVPVGHVKPKRQKVETVSINLTASDGENEDEETTSPVNKVSEKCKFWPACANGNQCAYHHPTTPCRSFPNCKFGDKCLYIHPNCKYDAKCTKPDCPFTHASKRPAPVKQILPQYIVPAQTAAFLYPVAAKAVRPSTTPAKPTCRFFPKCTNMNCPFAHPKPCRYGMSCANKATCTFSHPTLPGKDQFKWSSGTKAKKETEHISERKFDQGPTVSTPKT